MANFVLNGEKFEAFPEARKRNKRYTHWDRKMESCE